MGLSVRLSLGEWEIEIELAGVVNPPGHSN